MGCAFNSIFRALLVGSRWLMAPLCLGLVAALLILLVQFARELAHTVTGFAAMRDAEVILAVLKLVDLVLVANLVIMIIEAALAIFLPRHALPIETDAPVSGTAAFAALKPKLFASIAAIAAIDLLESFVNINSVDKAAVLWETVILLAFVAAGVLLAWMDRLEGRH
ncbi:MAG TPA: YqhA family protein [Stellaceae bacterium]|nr:YqhA family protein [Stellaceae bacterium]